MSFRLAPCIGPDVRRQTTKRRDDEKTTVNPDSPERRSRDTRPLPARRNAAPCKAAQPPPPPAMKRLALILPRIAAIMKR